MLYSTVTTLADEIAETTDLATEAADGGGLSLREAIAVFDNPHEPNTITFANNLFGGTIILTNGELVMSREVIIDGDLNNDHTPDIAISGNNASRVLNITASAWITGLIIEDGTTSEANYNGAGAGINARGYLELTDSIVQNNSSSGSAGGIYGGGGLVISNSVITNNYTALTGGGIWAFNQVRIEDSTITGNSTAISHNSSSRGGGLSVYGETLITGSTISDNSSSAGGGGGIFSGIGNLTISDSTISGNYTKLNGGGIHSEQNHLTIVNSSVTENTSTGFGGGIHILNADATIADTTISGNQALFGGGVAIFADSPEQQLVAGANSYQVTGASISTFTNTVVFGNRADSRGAGIFSKYAGVVVANSTVTGNRSLTSYDTAGGGLHGEDSVTLVTNSIIAGNAAYTGFTDIYSNAASGQGAIGYSGTNIFSQTGAGGPGDIIETALYRVFATTAPSPFSGIYTGVLENNGGRNQTIEILRGGLAHNAGDNNNLPTGLQQTSSGEFISTNTDIQFDGRGVGYSRTQGSQSDIGAFELSGPLTLIGTADDDSLDGGDLNDVISGEGGDDTLNGGLGDDLLDGGAGIDTASYENNFGVKIYLQFTGQDTGSAGIDTLIGIENLIGSAFSDRLVGDDNDNILTGGDGHDILKGKGGNNILHGGNGIDKLVGGNGNDELNGGAGRDTLFGGAGNDFLSAFFQLNALQGFDNGDRLFGGRDDDTLIGDAGNDKLRGNHGNDLLSGSYGNDDLRGGGQNDILYGDAGDDFLVGGSGFDVLSGGLGNDVMIGGVDSDNFQFDIGWGFDRIKDFENDTDSIDLTGFNFASFSEILAISHDTVTGLRIDTGSGNVLFVENFFLSDFSTDDVWI